jgi:hypothetical protein
MKKSAILAFILGAIVLAVAGCHLPTPIPLEATGGEGGIIADQGSTDFDLVITQPGFVWSIDSITIEGLAHTYAGDIAFTLVSPAGEAFLIRDRTGGGANFNGDYTFMPGAADSFSYSGFEVQPGTYGTSPDTNFENDLYGDRVNGTWRLRISDELSSDSGSILGWSMNLNYYTND